MRASYDVPETALATDAAAGTLPNVGMVVPDLCNDAHDCSLSVADSGFQTRMQKIFAGPTGSPATSRWCSPPTRTTSPSATRC